MDKIVSDVTGRPGIPVRDSVLAILADAEYACKLFPNPGDDLLLIHRLFYLSSGERFFFMAK
jgi:hypothetical protein